MNKIYMTKRGHDGKTVVCSEKTRARGKVKSLVLAVAAVGSIMSTTPSFAATAVNSGGTTGNFGSGSIEGFYATGESAGDLALTGSGETVATGGDAIAIGTNATANSSKGSIALGGQAKAIGTKATVIGYNAQAIRNENNATRGVVVIGQDALIRNVATVGQNRGAMAIGDNALAGFLTADGATAGTPVSLNDADYATKSGGFTAGRLLYRAGVIDESGATISGLVSNEATAIGLDSRAIGDQSIAIGAQVVAGHASVSIGGNDLGAVNNGTNKTIYKDIAGTDLASNNINSVTGAPGGDWFDTTYAKDGSTAIGIKAHSNELFGTALGTSAFVQSGAELGTAIGTGARVGSQSENLDANLTASPAFTTKGGVAIAAGAVAERDYTTAIGTGSKAIQISATATGYKAVASAQNATAMGSQATASANDTIALGTLSSASGLQSIAIGKDTVVSGVQSIAVGKGHIVEADNAGVFGGPSRLDADADGSYAIGNNNTITSANTFVLGSGIGRSSTDLAVESGDVTVANSVYLGNESEVTPGAGIVAPDGIGALKTWDKDQLTPGVATTAGANGTVSTATVNYITYGSASVGGQAFAGAATTGAVSVGSSGAERRIQNVAAGEISKTSTDAINGSQLYAVAHQASKPITFKANYNLDSLNATMNFASDNGLERILGDEIVIKGANVGTQLSRNGDIATKGNYSARNIQTIVDDQGVQIQIATNPIFDSVQFGSKEGPKITNDGANIKVGDSTGVPTKITNVAPGTSPNDAVNLSQLSANRTSVAPGDNTHVKTSDLAGGGTTYTVHADKAVVSQGDGVTITPDVATDPAKGTVTTTYNVALSQDTKNKLDRVETVIAGDSGLVTVTSPNNNNTGGKEFKVDITKGTFAPVSSTGALAAPTTDGVATVSDVVTAVNSGYWTANVDDSTKVADVKFGDSLNFVDGTATDAVVKNGGVSFNVKTDGSTIVVDGATNSLKVNTDALPKTVVAQGNNTVVSSETVGTTTTYKVDAEKTTVSKAATSPITVTEGTKSAAGVTNYEVGLSIDESTLEVVDGKLTAKVVDTDTNTDKSVRVAGSDLVTVTNTTGAADGITTMTDYTVSINKGSFGTTTDGSIVTGTDGVATVGDVMTAVNTGYWTANVGGAKLADVKFGDTLSFVDGNGTKAVVKNGGVAYDLNVKSTDGSIVTTPNTDGSLSISVNTSVLPKTVVDAGKGIDVTPVTNGNTTTYTVAVDDTIADKQYVADEIAKIPVVTDTNTDKSVRVKSDSELLTVAGTAGAVDGITTMTDYTITLSDKVATKDFVADEIAKIPTVTDTNTISEVERGDGITVNAVTEGDKTTYTVALDDATKAQLAKEESVVAKAGETNIVVTQPRTNGTGGNEYEVSLAKDLTGIDSIGKDGSKFTFNGDSISAGNVNITDVKSPVNATDAANKQYVDDAIAKIPAVVDTNTDKSVRVNGSDLVTVTNATGAADGITTMTDYTISLSDKVATKDFVTEEIAKIQLPVDTDTNSISKVEQGKGVAVTSVVNGDTTTFTVAVDDTIADKQYVADEIAKIKMPEFTDTNTVSEVAAGDGILVNAVTEGDKTTYTLSLDKTKLPNIVDTNTDKSVRVSSDSELITVTSAEGAADGITTMTDYTISVSDKVATKDYVDSKLPVVEAGDNVVVKTKTVDGKSVYTVSANSSSITKGDGIAVEMTETTAENGSVSRDYKVSLDDATKAQLAKEESVVAKAGQTNIKVTQPRTNGTGGNEFEVDLASDLTNINSIANGDTKLSLGDAQVNVNGATITNVASPVNATDAVNKQYVDDSKPTVIEGYGITVTETLTTKGAATSIDYNVSLNEKTKQTLVQVAVNTGNINKGINTKAEDGKVTNHQLGDTISVVGDNKNITTATTEDGAISVKMADDIKVNSVSINNTGITMGGNGIHAGDMKVTGVAPGTLSPSSTDAVNGSQLYATNMQVAQNAQDIRNLGDQLGDMRDEYRAGIADAAAVAGLPEIHLAGKSMFAVAGSTFKGESALAVGYSRLSDNSMTKFKASGSVNTQGDVLGTVGIGWAW